MIWIHIGMPKTGTTALQAFLRSNAKALDEKGLHYMRAGRTRPEGGNLPISHNPICFDIGRGGHRQGAIREEIVTEWQEHRDKTCIISSEMLYSVDPSYWGRLFADIPREELGILYFIRSYDGFWEADYKQRAKNGRAATGATAFVTGQMDRLRQMPEYFSFGAKTQHYREAFPDVQVVPRIYDRQTLVNGSVIDDFVSGVGIEMPEVVRTGSTTSNSSLSRAASDAFGMMGRVLGKQANRRLRREVPENPVMFRKNDVLEPLEREELMDRMNRVDETFRAEYFPERPILFQTKELNEADKAFRRDTPAESAALLQACEIVADLAIKAAVAEAHNEDQQDQPDPSDDAAAAPTRPTVAARRARMARRRARRAAIAEARAKVDGADSP